MPTPPPVPAPRRLTAAEFVRIGASGLDLSDPYHLALTIGWPTFAAGVIGLYGLINALFAGLYLLIPGCIANARPGSIGDAFFFSIETLATVGYGVMAPANLYGHLIASTEIVSGMAFTAIMTGLVFVRFSKPKAKIIYSENPVITRHNGRPTLMLRIGNGRSTLLAETHVRLNALLRETSQEGGAYRRVHELRLARSNTPIFPLTLTLMHEIDEASPLAGFDLQNLATADLRLLLSIEARDPGLAAMVYDYRAFEAADIRYGMRFVDAVSQTEDGRVVGDMTRVSTIEPDGL